MIELNDTPEIGGTEYLPGALGEFMTPVEKTQLAIGKLGGELIELAIARSQPFELPSELEQLVVSSHIS